MIFSGINLFNALNILSLYIAASSFNFTTGFEITANIPYFCSIVSPTSFEFDIDSASPSKVEQVLVMSYTQNGTSEVSISPIILTSPSNSQVVSNILVGDLLLVGDDNELVLQASSANSLSVSRQMNGNVSLVDHPILISIEETMSPTLNAGTYEVASTISCSQSL